PSNLSVTASPGQLGLAWQDNTPNESGFEVLRSTTGPLGTFSLLATTAANVTSYLDTGLNPAQQYCYKVQAVAHKGILGVSETVCAAPLKLQPAAASRGGHAGSWALQLCRVRRLHGLRRRSGSARDGTATRS